MEDSYNPVPPKPAFEMRAMRSDEFDKLRSDADRWRFVARHWTKARMAWNRDAGNTPKALVLEMKFSVTASSGAQLARFIDEALAAEKAVMHNAAGNRLAEGKSGLTGLLGGPARSEKE